MSPCLRNTEPRNYAGFGLPRAGFDVSSCNSPDTGVLSYLLRSFWLIPTFAASPVPVIVTKAYLKLPSRTFRRDHEASHFTHSRMR